MITAPKAEFKTEYIRLISPQYSIFSRVANIGNTKPYVIIQNVRSSQLDTKDTEGYEIEVSLIINTSYLGDKEVDEISSNIQKAIMQGKVKTNVVLTDFNIENTEVIQNESIGELIQTPTQVINNYNLVFKHRITQKT